MTIREDCRPYCHRFPVYALCRFLWDPDQDLDALKRDWCSRVYGPAADEMFAYLTSLEDAWGVDDHIGGYNGSPDRHADKFVTKEPFLRSLEYMFPNQGYAAVKDQFMIGDFLLVAPQLEKGAAERTVVIPPGNWMADDGTTVVGPATLSVATPLARFPYFARVRPGPNTKD